MAEGLTAARFVERLNALQSDVELEKIRRYFKAGAGDYGEGDVFIGVRMGHIFDLAKEFIDLPPDEIEILLESPIHEQRVGALSIMGKQAARKKTPATRRKELYDLYLRRTDRINNWDLVDLSARQVIGAYLLDKPRDVLYELACSANLWERRIAMFATAAFIAKGETADTFRIAEMLLHDEEDLIHKVVGGMLRAAGGSELLSFLDTHAAVMPRTMLRYAIEHLDAAQKTHYMGLKKASSAQ